MKYVMGITGVIWGIAALMIPIGFLEMLVKNEQWRCFAPWALIVGIFVSVCTVIISACGVDHLEEKERNRQK